MYNMKDNFSFSLKSPSLQPTWGKPLFRINQKHSPLFLYRSHSSHIMRNYSNGVRSLLSRMRSFYLRKLHWFGPFVRFPEPFIEVPYFVLGTVSYWLKRQWKEENHLEVVLATAHLPFSAWSGEYFIKSLRYYVNYNSLQPWWPTSMSCSSKALVAPTTVWLIQRGQHSFYFYFLNFYSKYSVPSMSSSPPSPSPSWLFLLRPGSQYKLLYLAFIRAPSNPWMKDGYLKVSFWAAFFLKIYFWGEYSIKVLESLW